MTENPNHWLKDVAAHAGVAMGTLYRRFHSKEDLLVAALERETRAMADRVIERPPKGATASERVAAAAVIRSAPGWVPVIGSHPSRCF